MNDRKEDLDKIVDKHLGLFDSPPPQDVAGSRGRILDRLRSRAANGTRPAVVHSTKWKWRLSAAAAAVAATLVLFAVLAQWHANRNAVYAVVDDAGGGIYRIESGEALRSGERIEANETVRTNGGVGTVLKLADGSSIEMRSKSELFLERADDGIRIRLSHGSVIVNAAPQRTGHLYVRTKEMTVSVVGTVFLVNAEEEGSRVAVLQGEVRVTQGETETSLRPGEQVTTNPKMESIPLKEELTWSRQAKVHVAMLEQTSTSGAAQPPKEDKVVFELESIRPTGLPPGNVGRGGGGGGGLRRPAGEPCGDGGPGFLQLDDRRFAAHDMTLHLLVTWAYGMDCYIYRGSDLLFGGPDWTKSDGFDIEALIPAGTPSYTKQQFLSGGAPQLQKMLQNLLADRFKLVLRRETREMPVYILTAPKGGSKLTPWNDADEISFPPIPGSQYRRGNSVGPGGVTGRKRSMADLASTLGWAMGRPVLDRTNLAGDFNYSFSFAPLHPPGVPWPAPGPSQNPSIFSALEENLGLKLEATRAPVEVLVIQSVEKPSEN